MTAAEAVKLVEGYAGMGLGETTQDYEADEKELDEALRLIKKGLGLPVDG